MSLPSNNFYGQFTLSWGQKLKIESGVAQGRIGDPARRYLTVQDGVDAGIIEEPESDNLLSAPPSATTDYLTPTPPSTIPVLSSGTADLLDPLDGTIITRVKVTWGASSDTGVIGYNVEWKPTSSSIWIPGQGTNSRTDALSYLSPMSDGDVIDVRVNAFNAGLKQSTWVTTTSHLIQGKTNPPPDMSGFVAAQNGNVAVFRWDQILHSITPDYSGAELRYGLFGSSSWASATPLTKVTKGTNITSADLPPGNWTCFLKAVDSSNNYSINAVQDDLNFINTYDVLTHHEEEPIWAGTLTNFVKSWDGMLVPQSTLGANAHTNAQLFEQFVPFPFATCSYEVLGEVDVGFNGTSRVWMHVDSYLGRGATGIADPKTHLDYRLSAGAYDGYEQWTIGNREFRYAKFKFILDTAVGKAYVKAFHAVIDNEEFTQSGVNVSIGAGGTFIAFAKSYHKSPFVDVPNFTTGGAVRIPVADAVTVAGFTAIIYNATGVAVADVLPSWKAAGI